MNEASVTTGRVTACRLSSGHIKLTIRNEGGSIAQEMIVTKAESCDIRSSLGMLELILLSEEP